MAGLVQQQMQQQLQQLRGTRCPVRPAAGVRRVRSPAVSVQAYLSGAARSSFVGGSSNWARSLNRQLSSAGRSSNAPMK